MVVPVIYADLFSLITLSGKCNTVLANNASVKSLSESMSSKVMDDIKKLWILALKTT